MNTIHAIKYPSLRYEIFPYSPKTFALPNKKNGAPGGTPFFYIRREVNYFTTLVTLLPHFLMKMPLAGFSTRIPLRL